MRRVFTRIRHRIPSSPRLISQPCVGIKSERRLCTVTSTSSSNTPTTPFRASNSSSLPAGFWKSKHNRREYLDFMKDQLGGQYESLYKLTIKLVRQTGGAGLLWYYNDSLLDAVTKEYPEHQWQVWKFERLPQNFWPDLAARFEAGEQDAIHIMRQYISDLEKQLSIPSPEFWEVLLNTHDEATLAARLGYGVETRLSHFGGLRNLLQKLYPSLKLQQEEDKAASETDIGFDLKPFDTPDDDRDFWKNESKQREYMDFLRQQLGGSYEAMYSLTSAHIIKTKGSGLLRLYNSVAEMVSKIMPEYNWKIWRFAQSPRGYWSRVSIKFAANEQEAINEIREYIKFLEKQYEVSKPEDWITIMNADLLEDEDAQRLSYFRGILNVLKKIYPHINWPCSPDTNDVELQPFDSDRLVPEFWKSAENRKEYLHFLMKQLGGTYESMYGIQQRHLVQTGGTPLLLMHNGSAAQAIMTELADEYQWKAWKFTRSPRGWWTALAAKFKRGEPEAVQTVREFIEDLATKLGVKQLADWENVTMEALGPTVIKQLRYLGRLPNVLKFLYPTHNWGVFGYPSEPKLKPFTSKPLPPSFWHEPDNRKEYLKFLKEQFGNSMDALYELTTANVIESGGQGILPLYQNSPALMLSAEFPDHPWQIWRFRQPPKGFWHSLSQKFKANDPLAVHIVRDRINELAELHQIEKLEDWYRVSSEHLSTSDWVFLELMGKLPTVLSTLYPEHKWELEKFNKASKRSLQWRLQQRLRILFSDEEILEDATSEDLNFRDKLEGTVIEYDIVLPRLKVVFDVQGGQDTDDILYFHDIGASISRIDMKKTLCERNNYSFIEVPYWWDGTVESLANTLYHTRPDLVPKLLGDGKPIADKPTDAQRARHESKLAKLHFTNRLVEMTPDPTGWWICEQLDGVRCMWDGRRLFTDTGFIVKPALGWVQNLPDNVTLDGVLWIDYNHYQDVVDAINARYRESLAYLRRNDDFEE